MKNTFLLFTCLLTSFFTQAQDTCVTITRCLGDDAGFAIQVSSENYVWQSSIDSSVWVDINAIDSLYTATANSDDTYYRVNTDNDSSLCWLLKSISISVEVALDALCSGDSSLIAAEITNCDGCPISWTVNSNIQNIDESTFLFIGNNPLEAQQENIVTASVSYAETDGYSCVADAAVNIIVNALPNFELTVSNTCLNLIPQVSVTPEIANADYSWNNGASTLPTFTPSSDITGDYTLSLQLTNSNGCSNTETAPYSIYALPTGSISGEETACSGESVNLTANSLATDFSWTAEGLSSGTEEQFTITSAVSGVLAVQLVITDANSCTATLTQNIEFFTLPEVTIQGTDSICINESITLTASSGTTNDVNYSWSDNSENANLIFQSVDAGEFTFSVEATNTQGCSATEEVTIVVNPLPQFNITGDTSPCGNTTFELSADNSDLSYAWLLVNDSTISTTNSIVYEGSFEPLTIQVIGIDAMTQCQNTVEVSGQAIAGPISTLPAFSEFCDGQEAVIIGQSGFEITWHLTGNNIAPDTILGPVFSAQLEVGTYEVFATITDTLEDCTSLDTLNLVVHSNPMFTLNTPEVTCENQPMQFLVTDVTVAGTTVNNYTIYWTNSSGSGSTENPFTENNAEVGNYSIEASVTEMDHNCSSSETLEVSITSGPAFWHPQVDSACLGENVMLEIDSVDASPYNVLWTIAGSTAEGNSIVLTLIDTITSYSVSVTDSASGCITDSTYSIEALPLPEVSEITMLTNGLLSVSIKNENGYTWGYTAASTGIEIILSTNDNYAYFDNFDPANNFYWVEYSNSNGCVLRIYFNEPLNIDTNFADDFVAYPIPVSSQLNIESAAFMQDLGIDLSVIGSLGQIVWQGRATSNNNRITLDTSKLSVGHYYLLLKVDSTLFSIPFTK